MCGAFDAFDVHVVFSLLLFWIRLIQSVHGNICCIHLSTCSPNKRLFYSYYSLLSVFHRFKYNMVQLNENLRHELIFLFIAPKLVTFHSRLSQNEGTKLKILCSMQEGSKPVSFEWHKNGNRLKDSSIDHKIDYSDDDSLLTIYELSSDSNANFSCTVRNEFGKDTQSTWLTVKGLMSSCLESVS